MASNALFASTLAAVSPECRHFASRHQLRVRVPAVLHLVERPRQIVLVLIGLVLPLMAATPSLGSVEEVPTGARKVTFNHPDFTGTASGYWKMDHRAGLCEIGFWTGIDIGKDVEINISNIAYCFSVGKFYFEVAKRSVKGDLLSWFDFVGDLSKSGDVAWNSVSRTKAKISNLFIQQFQYRPYDTESSSLTSNPYDCAGFLGYWQATRGSGSAYKKFILGYFCTPSLGIVPEKTRSWLSTVSVNGEFPYLVEPEIGAAPGALVPQAEAPDLEPYAVSFASMPSVGAKLEDKELELAFTRFFDKKIASGTSEELKDITQVIVTGVNQDTIELEVKATVAIEKSWAPVPRLQRFKVELKKRGDRYVIASVK